MTENKKQQNNHINGDSVQGDKIGNDKVGRDKIIFQITNIIQHKKESAIQSYFVENKRDWIFLLAVIANISQILLLALQIILDINKKSLPIFVFLILTFITATIGLLAILWIIQQPQPPPTPLQSKEARELSMTMVHAKIILIVIFCFFVASLIYAGSQIYLDRSIDKIIIVVTHFSDSGNSNSADQSVSRAIFDTLEKELKDQEGVTIIPVLEGGNNLDTLSARKIGDQHKADIVIWGWYTVRQDNVLINPHIEILTNNPNFQPFQLRQKTIPKASYESFELERILSNDYSYLTLFTIGTIRRSQQRYIDAIASYSKIIEQNDTLENISLVYNMRGLSFHDSDQYQEALNDYIRAIELSPADSIHYYNLGVVQSDMGEIKNAITNLNYAVELNPDFARPLNLLAWIYHEQGDVTQSEYYYNRAIQLEPEKKIYHTNLAGLYIEEGKYDLALEQINISLQYERTDWYLHYLKYETLIKQQDWGFALWEWTLYSYYSEPIPFIILLSLLLFLLSFFILRIINKKQYNKVTTWFFLKILLGVSSIILTMFGFNRQGYQQYQNHIIIKILVFGVTLRFNAYLISGNESEAVSFAETAISRGIQNTTLLTELGISYFRQHQYDLATTVFLDVLKNDAQNGHAHFGLGRIYLENNDLTTSLLSFQQATVSSEYAVESWLWAGDIYWKLGDFRGAIVSWSNAVKIDSQYVVAKTLQELLNISQLISSSAHLKLGLAYTQLGTIKNARTGFTVALNQGSNLPVTLYTELAPYVKFKLQNLKQTNA